MVIALCLFSRHYSNLCTTTNNGRGGVLVDGCSAYLPFYLVLLYYVLSYVDGVIVLLCIVIVIVGTCVVWNFRATSSMLYCTCSTTITYYTGGVFTV